MSPSRESFRGWSIFAGGSKSTTARLLQRAPAHEVRTTWIALDDFDAVGSPLLSGRAFHAGDHAAGRTVIVNQSFVRAVLRGQNAVGRRIRYAAERDATLDEWQEIVGVAADLGMAPEYPASAAGLYHPLPPDWSARVAVHLHGAAAPFAARHRHPRRLPPRRAARPPRRRTRLAAGDYGPRRAHPPASPAASPCGVRSPSFAALVAGRGTDRLLDALPAEYGRAGDACVSVFAVPAAARGGARRFPAAGQPHFRGALSGRQQ